MAWKCHTDRHRLAYVGLSTPDYLHDDNDMKTNNYTVYLQKLIMTLYFTPVVNSLTALSPPIVVHAAEYKVAPRAGAPQPRQRYPPINKAKPHSRRRYY
jgi:hypothetical protein